MQVPFVDLKVQYEAIKNGKRLAASSKLKG